METIQGTREECEKKASEIIAIKIKEILAKKTQVILGITGGRSVEGIFKNLLNEEINWANIQIFMVDERCVSLHSLDSNYRLAYISFIKQLIESKKLPENNVHPFIYDPDAQVKCLRLYNEAFQKTGGKFDIVLLSGGEDGHITALYPKHRSITNESSAFIVINDAPKHPKQRMTASRKLLQSSSAAILLFFGKEKQRAYEKFLSPCSVQECPAKIINSIADSYILVSPQ